MRFNPSGWARREIEAAKEKERQRLAELEFFLHPDLVDLDANADFWLCVEAA